MKKLLFKIIFLASLFLSLQSCKSAEQLIQKAKRKDPNIILCKDSIIETKLPGETITLYGKDSVHIITNRVDILATYDSLGLKVSYKLKDTTITSKEITPVITPSPTKTEIRQNGKTERRKTKEEGKTDREKEDTKQVEIKATNKTAQVVSKQDNKGKGWFDALLVGMVIGAAAMYLFMVKFRKK